MTGKDIFKFDAIAVTGDFGPNRTSEKMKSWIQHHGGGFTSEISSNVTHLICSKEHFKREVAMVRQAKQYKHIKIVSFDWLEDSLLSSPQKRQPEKSYLMNNLVEVKAARKTRKKAVRKENIEQSIKKFDKSCQDFEKDMFSDGYHIYQDYTTFAYDITLARADLTTNKNQRYSLKVNDSPPSNEIASPASPTASSSTSSSSTITNPYASSTIPACDGRLDDLDDLLSLIDDYLPSFILPRPALPIFPSYLPPRFPRIRAFIRNPRAQRLQLYESHATPKRYACYVKYSASHEPTVPEMVAPINSSFAVAFDGFKAFFRLKVGREWDERLLLRRVGAEAGQSSSSSSGAVNNSAGVQLQQQQQAVVGAGAGAGAGPNTQGFVYTPPKQGPWGIVNGNGDTLGGVTAAAASTTTTMMMMNNGGSAAEAPSGGVESRDTGGITATTTEAGGGVMGRDEGGVPL